MSRREFHFTDEKSNKFWAISIDGSSTTVEWGRIGTKGQSKTKDFASASEAQGSYDKLVREKTKEGYQEVGGGAATAPAPTPAPAAAKPASPSQPPPAPRREEAGSGARVDLTPLEWRRATWRKLEPLVAQAAKPFDLEEAKKRAAKAGSPNHGWNWDWTPCEIAPALSREEAHFWFALMTNSTTNAGKASVHLEGVLLRNKQGFDGKLDAASVKKTLAAEQRVLTSHVVRPLLNLLSVTEVVDLALENPAVLAGLLDDAPYLDAKTAESLRAQCRGKLDPTSWPTDYYQAGTSHYSLAARLGGFEKELLALVESWPDDRYTGEVWHDHYQKPQEIVFGLGDPALVEQHWRRLRLKHRSAAHVSGWLAHTEASALDAVRDSILAIKNREEAEVLVEALGRVHAPANAPIMLELRRSSKAPKPAGEWLEKNKEHSIPGLLATAAGRGALAEAAVDWLRTRKRSGDEAAIAKAVAAAPADVAAKVRALVLEHVEKTYPLLDEAPPWLALPAGKKAKGPSWAEPAQLPPIVMKEKQLSPSLVETVLALLRASELEEPLPPLRTLRAEADRDTLDAFAWRLFELWLGESAPSKEKWALHAVGLLGSDASALRLAPLVRNWPGESQHARAVVGLECLRAIGSDVALMQLNGIAQKLKFKGLKARAQELMEAIAKDRNMTRPELEDRIVPDCDLDEKGSRTFDFGPRQFTFALGPDMKPMLRDAAGKLLPDLPKPGAKDDSEKAAPAVEAWKLMKKQIKEVAKIQAERLEQAMVTGRRWKKADFDALVVKHPLLTHLVRLLVLGGHDAKGKLATTFRVTEDGTFADSKDAATKLAGVDTVSIVHPLDLDDETRGQWGQVFADYELMPPFPQLGRPVFTLEKAEEKASKLDRLDKKKIAAVTLSGTLDRMGWERGVPQDAGIFCAHSKPFHGAGVTAVVTYEGIPIGGMVEWDDQEVESAYFISGIHGPQGYPDEKEAIPLRTVHAIAISEVLKDLAALAEKVKT